MSAAGGGVGGGRRGRGRAGAGLGVAAGHRGAQLAAAAGARAPRLQPLPGLPRRPAAPPAARLQGTAPRLSHSIAKQTAYMLNLFFSQFELPLFTAMVRFRPAKKKVKKISIFCAIYRIQYHRVISRNVSERGGCAGAVPALVAAGAERRVQRAAGGAPPRAAGRAAAAAAPGAAGGLPAAHAPGASRLPAADHLLHFKYCFISLKELVG